MHSEKRLLEFMKIYIVYLVMYLKSKNSEIFSACNLNSQYQSPYDHRGSDAFRRANANADSDSDSFGDVDVVFGSWMLHSCFSSSTRCFVMSPNKFCRGSAIEIK